jgi:uncharacterized protein (TIGR02145 family)
MRIIASTLIIFLTIGILSAQTVTLTFTAKDAGNHYVQLNRVIITNLTKSWQETIYWPDTVLTMQNGTGIDDHTTNGGFALSQNSPNPFSNTTDVTLTVSEEGAVNLDIADVNGRIVESQNLASLYPGNHQFQITLSTPGTYVMTARQNGRISSIKMICNGGGGTNTIDYLGEVQTLTYVLKSNTNKPFNFGDQMEYVGYAAINGTMEESQRITQSQGSSQTFTLQFAGTQIQYQMPTVATSLVSNITYTSASCGGTVYDDGGASITARGVCWGTSQNPTVSGNHTTNGTGTGNFTSNITGLTAGTTYYVRAYATNSVGTAYGLQINFTTPADLPTVTTGTISNVTTTTATCGGNVTSNGGVPVTARGVCWSTSQNPTISGNHTTNGSGTGSFTSNITGLSANTVYYVRAYATNSVGTAYGDQILFAAAGGENDGQPCPMATVTDYDGNIYNTVQIGNQCWMKENLKTTHFADGTSIPLGSASSTSSPSRCAPNSNGDFSSGQMVAIYGYLYNWNAAMYGGSLPNIVQGACPNGWHLPSDSEWTQLTNYVSCHSQYLCSSQSNTINIAKALASTTYEVITDIGWYGWMSDNSPCSVGNILSNNNATGFSAMPAGLAMDAYISERAGQGAYFWTSTPYMGEGVNSAYAYNLYYSNAYVQRGYSPISYYYSIRCLNDNGTVTTLPTVTTTPCNNITATSVVSGGNITSSGNASVTSRGVCWSTSPNPTVSGSHISNGSGTGSFTSNITGLTPNTIYYVRAYATNSAGTAYGEQRTFTTLSTPMVTTNVVSNIAVSSANCGGNVTSSGGSNVTARGVCWSTSQNPTVSGSHTTDGSGTGSFTSSITGLSANTTYYVRAYATNSAGTAYGEQRNFTTLLTTPTVTTNTVSNITATTAICGGNVTSSGGASVTARGVCWSTSQNPTVNGSHTNDGTGTGNFISSITGLAANTTYYVRAYATNSAGTTYGVQRTLTTTAPDWQTCPGTPTLTDIEGNVYNTVQIGTQCWMKENLRTTHYANGASIPNGGSTNDRFVPYYYNYSSSSIQLEQRGYLYNWPAVMHGASSSNANPSGVQGICPNGWHVPSYAELQQLENYVRSQNQYVCDVNNPKIAKALASTTGWNTSTNVCAVGNNQSENNATGFSAVPAGRFTNTDCENSGFGAYFWTATSEIGSQSSRQGDLSCSDGYFGLSYSSWEMGFSIRCVYNSSFAALPTVSTTLVTNVTETEATCGGTITADGGASVIARGVCWSTSQNPTVSGSHTTDGVETGSFTSNITGLTSNTTYYVRAYATNSAGTAYGEQRNIVTSNISQDGQPCPGATTISDYDGNTYNTVRIGLQCWMKGNLRTTHYSNGESISLGSTTSATTPYYYNYSSSSIALSQRGYLYNWPAVMHGANSSNSNPSGVQGICPTGWHVPSDAEWTQLTDYVISRSQYVCGNNITNIAKALAANTGWNTSSGTCNVGNNQSANNATGFSAVPAGQYGQYGSNSGHSTFFWSSTEYFIGGQSAYIRGLGSTTSECSRGGFSNETGCSVRCLRDEGGSTTAQLPTVTTASVTSIAANSATCGGNVTATGGANVTARGVCWSTSQNPTVANSHTTDGSGTGSFTSSITGLSAGTTYYVRAYATNSAGTAYGNQVSFTTTSSSGSDGQPCPSTPTVSDYDGNTYNTVKIGQQCWMKENLRTTHYSNGASIPAGGSSISSTNPYYYNNTSSSIPLTQRGYLYNWSAVMHGASSSSANPSGVQGICPTGWHVPSGAEWTQLIAYLSNQNQYVCGGNNSYLAKALASTSYWNSSTSDCTPGNNPSTNNPTGFSAVPVGCFVSTGQFFSVGGMTDFWSTTKSTGNNERVEVRGLNKGIPYVDDMNPVVKEHGRSVRCLKD